MLVVPLGVGKIFEYHMIIQACGVKQMVRHKRPVDISQLNGDSPLEMLGMQKPTSQVQNEGGK